MDPRADHYAELLIPACAALVVTTKMSGSDFAESIWNVAEQLAKVRARRIEEALQRIPAPASTGAPEGGSSPPLVPPAGEVGAGIVVDEELAPFLEATRELRGRPVEASGTCEGGDLEPNDCVNPAVERVAHVRLCFRHAREEFAAIALDPTEGGGIEAARAEAFISTRGPAAPKEASRGGVAPAAPEVGAQPHEEVAGHAAVEVAQEDASPVQPVQEVHHEEPLVEVNAKSDLGEVAGTVAVPAPRSELVEKLHERDSLKDAAQRLGDLPQIGREVFTNNASREADPPAPRTGKRGRPTKAKSVSMDATVACGGGPGCHVENGIEHHNPATCPKFKPREVVTPKPEGIKRASELAAKFEGTP